MNKMIFLLLFIINIPVCAWAEEDKFSENKALNIVTEDSMQKERGAKDQEIKEAHINLFKNIFKNNYITQEDLGKSKILNKQSQEEIVISKPINMVTTSRSMSEPVPDIHQRSQQKFRKYMLRTQTNIIRNNDRNNKNNKNNNDSFAITPFQAPFVAPLNDW